MNIKLAVASAVVFAGTVLLAGNASAQWGGAVQVWGAVEPFNGQYFGSVSTARCGNNVLLGFGDSESGNNNSFAGYAVSSDGGRTFADKGVLPADLTDNFGFGGQPLRSGPVACANSSTFYYAGALTEGNVRNSAPPRERAAPFPFRFPT